MKYVISYQVSQFRDSIVLRPDNWDDYGCKTLFSAWYIDKDGEKIELGSVKIGKKDFEKGWIEKCLEDSFTELSSDFFSLWQSAESYQKVREIEERYDLKVFETLHDMAYDLSLLERFAGQNVVEKSLCRFISKHMCVNQFHRIAHGEAVLTPYHFDYVIKQKDKYRNDLRLEFSVRPNSLPPTNVHAIIGGNGTGKTTLIKNMIKSIFIKNKENSMEKFVMGEFVYPSSDDELGYFESVMCVSFSPFDNYSDVESCQNFNYIGVRKEYSEEGYEDGHGEINLLDDIRKKFIESYRNCIGNRTKKKDWIEIIKMLGSDGDYLIEAYNFADRIEGRSDLSYKDTREIERIFDDLSAGHKEVLSIITRCIDQLAEKTILLIDEPENHLHPPLLSSLIRGISQMLIKRNGVALISTHSPIVLQEIPSSCVWILNRQGNCLFAYRPEIETFGTNIGVLTNEVFGYEVKKSGFHMLLQDVVKKCETYEEVLEQFNCRLGNEAKNMVRILLAQKEEAGQAGMEE